ncbi:hypothetical protein V1264_015175 [Littorina saxatilis]|uniref:Uncharacterized protein n=2 Tax=Littorina saxatilis TaxID=31220 RepID=A0AAN9GG67_9CAEN
MSVSRVLCAVTALCVVVSVLHVQVATATTDPVAANCGPLCREYNQVATECGVMRNCYDYAYNDTDTFTRCLEPCWDLSGPCFGLCATNFDSNFDKCLQQCEGDDDYDCVSTCFDDTFIQQRDSKLTLPSPDIGPFVQDA